jgi:hypothetical protein
LKARERKRPAIATSARFLERERVELPPSP